MSGAVLPPLKTRKLGRTNVSVTELGLGTAPLGELFDRIDDNEAAALIAAAWDGGVRYFRHLALVRTRTCRAYARPGALSQAARRLRHIDQDRPRPAPAARAQRDQGPVAGRARVPDRVQLWLRRRDALVRGQPAAARNQSGRRPPDSRPRPLGPQSGGAQRLFHRSSRRAGGGRSRNCARPGSSAASARASTRWAASRASSTSSTWISSCLAMRYTLLEQEVLESEFPRCAERGVGIIIGGGYNSGILATGAVPGAMYNYAPAGPEILERVRQDRAASAPATGSHCRPPRSSFRSGTRSSPRSSRARFPAPRLNGTSPPSATPFQPTCGRSSSTRS